MTCPASDEAFYGQDAQFDSFSFDFQDNGDGTVSDLVTGLMWEKNAQQRILQLARRVGLLRVVVPGGPR